MAAFSAIERLQAGDLDPDTQRLFVDPSPEAEIAFIETFLTIDNERGQIVPFKLYPQQRQMAYDHTGRDLTVKGRQTRASSYILARDLRRMITGEGLKCLVMTQDDQTTATFRARIKHHLQDLEHAGWRFPIGLDNEDELVLAETECRYVWGSGEERVAGRAYTGHIVHLSEFAHWPPERASALLGGIQPSVPGPPFGWIDIESTPKGAEGQFYEMVVDSRLYNPLSRWAGHFYSWWMEPRYRAGTVPGCDIVYPEQEWEHLLRTFEPTQEEERLMEEYNLDVGQILWRRVKKAEQDKTDAPFLQEYVETIEGCFLTAGGNYFASPDGINHLEKYRHTLGPPKEIIDRVPGSSVGFMGPNLYVWQRPQQGRPYCVWVDCAGGGLGEDADYSAILVLDAAEMFVAARLAVKAAPQEVAPMAAAIAHYYNNALLGGERDAFGSVCLTKIQEVGYRNLWYYIEPGKSMSIDKAIEAPWGHPTAIRNHTLNALRERVFSGTFHTSDAWLVQQMGSFTWSKVAGKRELLKAQAKKGQKDDLVMCAAGCCYIAPLAGARYRARRGPEPGQPIQEGEVVTVGPYGLVLNRQTQKSVRTRYPWIR